MTEVHLPVEPRRPVFAFPVALVGGGTSVLRRSGGGHESFASIKEDTDSYVASLVLGVAFAVKPTLLCRPNTGDNTSSVRWLSSYS